MRREGILLEGEGTPMQRVLIAALVAASVVSVAQAATPGYIEDFSTGTANFFSQATLSWVPTGGVGGAGDGYLSVSRDFPFNLGATTAEPQFTGNLTADGVTGFEIWLNDIGADDPLEIHVGLGVQNFNFWLYTIPFIPANGAWQSFVVDFSNPSDWVQTIGAGTFADALANNTRLLIRHDLAPFEQLPDSLAGDFGIDRIRVIPEPATLGLVSLGCLLLRRRAR